MSRRDRLVVSGFVNDKFDGHFKVNEMAYLVLDGRYQSVADFGSTQLIVFYINGSGRLSDITFNKKSTGGSKAVFDLYRELSSVAKGERNAKLAELMIKLEEIGLPKINLVQLGSHFKADYYELAPMFAAHGIETRNECSHLTGVERLLTMHSLSHRDIALHIDTMVQSCRPLKVVAGTVGAAVMGRDKYTLDETLLRLRATRWDDESHKPAEKRQDPKYRFVAELLEAVYPTEHEIIAKLNELGRLSSAEHKSDVLIYGNTGGGSNPGFWVLFSNGVFSAFELNSAEFKALRESYKPKDRVSKAKSRVRGMSVSDSVTLKAHDNPVVMQLWQCYSLSAVSRADVKLISKLGPYQQKPSPGKFKKVPKVASLPRRR